MAKIIKARTITAQRARLLLHYNPETGVFRWKSNRGGYSCVGKEAGTISNGYRQIEIDGVLIRANRLAVLRVTGELPPSGMVVDHIDHNRSNDAWANLRVCTQQQNCRTRNPKSNNTGGRIGVCWLKPRQKWNAYIGLDNKNINLGYYDTQVDAIAAREAAEQEYFGKYAGSASAA